MPHDDVPGVDLAPAEVAAPRELPPEKEVIVRRAITRQHPTATHEELENQLYVRSYWFRKRYLTWLKSLMDFEGTEVLEIGSGTGNTAIPFLECGARVDMLDVNEADLDIALLRGRLHGLSHRMRLHAANAADVAEVCAGRTFDLIVFTASLEHMTHRERIASLAGAWKQVRPGGLLAVVDTPNRLWFFDNHTTFANFFNWLPNDLAIDYAPRMGRAGFTDAFAGLDEKAADEKLARWGRGVSYHEFELALGDLAALEISGEWSFQRQHNAAWAKWWADTVDGRYLELMKAIAPDLNPHWLEPEIAIAIRKP